MADTEKLTTVISTKGQIILPKTIRRHRRWDTGTRLLVEETPEGVLLKAAPVFSRTRPEDVFASLPHSGAPKTIEDMKADSKWPDYRAFCDRLFFATLEDVPEEIFPDECGFIRADTHGAALLREAPEHKLAGARRKAVTLRIAQSAAHRLFAAELSGVNLPE